MYRIADGYGKKGVEILGDNSRVIRFYPHPEISLNNRVIIP